MTDRTETPEPEGSARRAGLRRRTVLGLLAALAAILTRRRPVAAGPAGRIGPAEAQDEASDAPKPKKRPLWIGH